MKLTERLATGAMLFGALAVGSGNAYAGDAKMFGKELFKSGVRQGVTSQIRTNIEGSRGTTVNNNNCGNPNGFVESYVNSGGLSKDDARVLREIKGMNRIVAMGDWDNNGEMNFNF